MLTGVDMIRYNNGYLFNREVKCAYVVRSVCYRFRCKPHDKWMNDMKCTLGR